MEILSTTITARATANYQVGEVAIQIANYNEQDIRNIESYAINEAVAICNELQKQTGTTKTEPVVQTQKTYGAPQNGQRYPANSYRAPVQNQQQSYAQQPNIGYNNQDSRANKPISEKQISYINSLGYQGPMPRTFLEADELLKRLKAEKGIQ